MATSVYGEKGAIVHPYLIGCLLCCTSAQAIWLSPDPLLDKYPYISPYAYCNWNPINYVDPDGKWEEKDGTVGLEPIGWTLFSVSYYDLFVGKGNPATGLYYGQWSISVAGLFGIFLDVDIVKKIKINLSAGIDLWKVSYNGEFDFSEIRNGKHNGMLGGGVKYKDYGGYFQESFKVYSGSMEYVPGSTTYSGGLLFSHASGTCWDGNITLSAALSAVLGLSVTISGNIYYQGQ